MFALTSRFTVLAVFCFISAQWLSPSLFGHAAVISRNSRSSASPFRLAAADVSPHSQRVFPWPSSRNGFHKVRSSNPIQQFADAMFSRIKHGRHRRSHRNIVIPTEHGKDYLISHKRRSASSTPQWIAGHGNSTNSTTTTQNNGIATPGAVRIQSRSSDPSQNNRILGSLVLTGTGTDGAHTLNASENNETRLYMVNAPTTSRQPRNGDQNENIPVYLAILNLHEGKNYCATYPSRPTGPQPMTMQNCENSPSSAPKSTSQVFMYNQTSSELRPTWDDVATPDSSTNSTNGTSTASGSPASSTNLSSRDDASTQNVTLIWVPAEKVAAADVSENPSDTQNGDSTSSAVTTTMTQTVTVFQTGSASFTSTSTSSGPSSTGLNVEVVGASPSPSASQSLASSMSMMDVPNSSASSSSVPSQSVDAAAVASSIAASASASMSSASASSSSMMATAADVSANTPSATASSDPSSSTFIAAVKGRAAWVRPDGR